ncbi:hypothetical protein ACP4OV_019495 [Aristida adscensionis]
MSLRCCSSLVLLLSLLLVSPSTTLAAGRQPSKPVLARLAKDRATSLYTISFNNGGAPLVVDLAGPLLWSACAPRQRTIAASATDGKNPLSPVSFSVLGSCAPTGHLAPLPSGAAGVAGLSRLPLSLPSQVASALNVAREFALCIPSGGETGAAIFGGGPFQLLAAPPVEVADGLRKAPIPFLRNNNNGAYYFKVTGVNVNNVRVPVPAGAFDLDPRSGRGGVVLSTTTPYTTLRSDIYRPLLKAFDAATSGIPRAAPVRPFQLCFQASALGASRLGFAVANIDLLLDGGRSWLLAGGSSLVQVNDRTVCFAFLEMAPGTAASGSPAAIFGGFQLEDHLLLVDLQKETFALSGPLVGIRTNCGNFNFTKA